MKVPSEMNYRDDHKVTKLPDRFDTGFGWGYGGRNCLYRVCIVDVNDPPQFVCHADTFEEALGTAQECLSEDIDLADFPELEGLAGEALYSAIESVGCLGYSESGRLVSTEDDIRVALVRDYTKRLSLDH